MLEALDHWRFAKFEISTKDIGLSASGAMATQLVGGRAKLNWRLVTTYQGELPYH